MKGPVARNRCDLTILEIDGYERTRPLNISKCRMMDTVMDGDGIITQWT